MYLYVCMCCGATSWHIRCIWYVGVTCSYYFLKLRKEPTHIIFSTTRESLAHSSSCRCWATRPTQHHTQITPRPALSNPRSIWDIRGAFARCARNTFLLTGHCKRKKGPSRQCCWRKTTATTSTYMMRVFLPFMSWSHNNHDYHHHHHHHQQQQQ